MFLEESSVKHLFKSTIYKKCFSNFIKYLIFLKIISNRLLDVDVFFNRIHIFLSHNKSHKIIFIINFKITFLMLLFLDLTNKLKVCLIVFVVVGENIFFLIFLIFIITYLLMFLYKTWFFLMFFKNCTKCLVFLKERFFFCQKESETTVNLIFF